MPSKIAGIGLQSGMRQSTPFLNAVGRNSFFRMRHLSTLVASDTFQGPDGQSLTNRKLNFSQGGNAWQQITPNGSAPVSDTVTIQGNRAAIGSSANGIAVDCGVEDVELQCDLLMGSASRCGFIVRGINNGNAVVVRIRQPESLIEVTDWAGGSVDTVGSSQALTSVQGELYHFRVVAQGDRVRVWRDGVPVLDESSVKFGSTRTRVGFTSFGSSLDERFDNFVVERR